MHLIAAGLISAPRAALYDATDWSKLSDPAGLPGGFVYGAAISPDGSLLALCFNTSPYLIVYRTSDWSTVTLTGPGSAAYCAAFSPDGAWLAVGHSALPYLTLYSTSTWGKTTPSVWPASTVNGVAWAPDGSRLAAAHNVSPYLTTYQTGTWFNYSPSPNPGANGLSCAYSPDGSILAVGRNADIARYQTSDWSKLAALGTPPSGDVLGVAFSPDGSMLGYAGAEKVAIYLTADWSRTKPATQPSSTAHGCAFSADGSELLVAHEGASYLSRYAVSDWSRSYPPTPPASAALSVAVAPLLHAALAGAAAAEAGAEALLGDAAISLAGDAQASAGAHGALAGGHPTFPFVWNATVLIGGVDVSASLTGSISVEAVEGEARIAELTLLPGPVAIEPATWIGQAITIDFGRLVGSSWDSRRVFTGLIDVPEFDPVARLLRLHCTDDLQGRLMELEREAIDGICGGRWSAAVFDKDADGWRYACDRMSTQPAALDIDPFGNLRVTPWAPAEVAAFAADEEGIIDESLGLRMAARSEIKNRVRIEFAYRFPRYKRRVVVAGFNAIDDLSTYLAQGIPVPTRAMILQALTGTGWEVIGDDPTWTPVPAGPIPVDIGGGQTGYWIVTDQNLSAMVSTTDGSQKVLDAVPIVAPSQAAADKLCFGFLAPLGRRYVQLIEERYDLLVEASESVARLGVLATSEQASMSVAADTSAWETWRPPQTLGEGSKATGQLAQEPEPVLDLPNLATGGETTLDYAPDPETDRAACASAIETLVAKAQAEIWASHRRHRVGFSVPLDPAADLPLTWRIDTASLSAQGKTARVQHRFDIDTGEAVTDVELAICAVAGLGIVHPGDEPAAPAAPDPPAGEPVFVASASEWVGATTMSIPWDADQMIGFSCNVSATSQDYDAEAPVYPEQFTFRAPAIEDEARESATIMVGQGYAAPLREDYLVVTGG